MTQSISSDGQTTLTGVVKNTNGSAAAPSITFGSDTTTGMYYIGTGHLGFSAAGTEIVAFNANNLGSGQSGNVLEVNTSTGTAYPCPVGAVMDFAGPTAPGGWLLCFGQVVNVSSYPELYVALGSTNTYGGNGTTTFGVPDCRGRFTAGKDNMGGSAANRITAALNFDGTVLGGVGGVQSYTILTANLPAIKPAITITDPTHTHTFTTTGTVVAALNPNFTSGGAGHAATIEGGTSITITAASTGITAAFTSNLGSATAFGIINPAIIFNKIIFAGRP